jgi:Asp-tRNA(Asn)/Glu-tRNA(Gln) amidotransferase A subunit family amidase
MTMSDTPARHSDSDPSAIDRRAFLAAAAATAAALGIPVPADASTLVGEGAGEALAVVPQAAPQNAVPQLGNGEMIALNFSPYPGGTGALMEKVVKERGVNAFKRSVPKPLPWGTASLPKTDEEIAFMPVHRLSAAMHAGKITSARLTDIYLARLKQYNPQLLCAVTILEESARKEAAERDRELKAGKSRGPLHGIPYGIKDLFAVKGTPTTWGCLEFENRVIDMDSEVHVRLRDAGAVLIAKLSTGLFAQGDQWFRGRTNNPWNLALGASGSSAGPGSATAAGCVAFSIGTETQGSIVSPSTRNGLSALRPTFGRTSRHGGMFLSWTQDKVGPMCRNAEDVALVFAVYHGADEKDPSTITMPFEFDRNIDLKKVRIGFDSTAPQALIDELRKMGADLKPIGARPAQNPSMLNAEGAAAFEFMVAPKLSDGSIPFPEPTKDPILRAREAAAAAAAATPGDTAGRGGRGGRGGGRGGGGGGAGAPAVAGGPPPGANTLNALRGRFTNGRTAINIDFVQAQRHRLRVMHEMAAIMKDFDMYVVGGGDTGLTNQTGHPAVVFPYSFGVPAGQGGQPAADGKPQPICVTVVGQLFADDKLLSVAHAFQKRTDFHARRPTIG